jgi:hypothetical protein
MLQTNCPQCKGVIRSPYLNDLPSIECDKCKELVTVDDVFVATSAFTIHREDLLNRITRFQRLLREVEKERALLTQDDTASEKTIKSVEQFYQTLQELLAGARSHFRLEMTSGLSVQIGSDDKNRGKLINLSSEGASIECALLENPPQTKKTIELKLTLPEVSEVLTLLAKVVWVRKSVRGAATQYYNVGVNFIDLDESVRASLWDFIVETASNPQAASTV